MNKMSIERIQCLVYLLFFVFVAVTMTPNEAKAGGQPFYEYCNGKQFVVAGTCPNGGQMPYGAQAGQPFMADINGRQVQMTCDIADRIVSGGLGALGGLAMTYIANHSQKDQFGRNVRVLEPEVPVLTGVIAGATVLCYPTSGKFIDEMIGNEPRQQQSSTERHSSGGSRIVDMCKNNRTGEIVGPADNGPDRCGRYRNRNVGNQQSEQPQSRTVATYTGSITLYGLSLRECEDKHGEFLGRGRCLLN